jgi:sugar-specific transcriptional regulator TrmB
MDEAKRLLSSAGLAGSEIAIYRAGLSHGAMPAGEFARLTGIKRPTVYHALGLLVQKGLASKSGNGLRQAFAMAHPSALERLVDSDLDMLTKKKEALKKLAPLLSKPSAEAGALAAEHYEGARGVIAVVDEALYCKSRKWDIIAPGKNFFSEFDPAYAERFMETRRSRGIVARSLWEDNRTRRILTDEEIRLRNPRFLPKAMHGKFSSVIILFDDKAAIIPPKDHLAAVLIRSKAVHDTFAAMFEGLYQAASPYKR